MPIEMKCTVTLFKEFFVTDGCLTNAYNTQQYIQYLHSRLTTGSWYWFQYSRLGEDLPQFILMGK